MGRNKPSRANKNKVMTKQDNATAAEAIRACGVLSSFLSPMLREARRDGDLGATQYFTSFLSDLATLRQSLQEMQAEDKASDNARLSASDNL